MVLISSYSNFRFQRALEKMEHDPNVCKMKNYEQHNGTSTFVHCRNVAIYSFYLAHKFGWDVDEEALVRGAMLHDYYLYNTADMTMTDYQHGTTHPQLALDNAQKRFRLTPKEKNIIRSHMWPLTFTHVPKSKEAFLVSLADKYCAVREMSGENDPIDPHYKTPWIRQYATGRISHLMEQLAYGGEGK